jgi:hypothetical protein
MNSFTIFTLFFLELNTFKRYSIDYTPISGYILYQFWHKEATYNT